MSRPTWDDTYLDLCRVLARRSKDESTKTACVIVGSHHQILSMGYNCFPRGYKDDVKQVRPIKYLLIEHAERNAIYNAAREGISLEGATAYILGIPCTKCTRALIQAGIEEIVVDGVTSGRGGHWMNDAYYSMDMLHHCKVKLRLKNDAIGRERLVKTTQGYRLGEVLFSEPDPETLEPKADKQEG